MDRASKAFVKKKAALTLLRLYRKHPAIVQHEWAERIISLMDDPDMGVALSVTSLVTALVQDNTEQYKGSYIKAANRLKRIVVDNECAEGYFYYKVPCPWILVKLLKLLQYYPPPGLCRFPLLKTCADRNRGLPYSKIDSRSTPKDHGLRPGNAEERTAEQRTERRPLRSDQPRNTPRHRTRPDGSDIATAGQIHRISGNQRAISRIGGHDASGCSN